MRKEVRWLSIRTIKLKKTEKMIRRSIATCLRERMGSNLQWTTCFSMRVWAVTKIAKARVILVTMHPVIIWRSMSWRAKTTFKLPPAMAIHISLDNLAYINVSSWKRNSQEINSLKVRLSLRRLHGQPLELLSTQGNKELHTSFLTMVTITCLRCKMLWMSKSSNSSSP